MKSIIIILFILSLLFIVIGYMENYKKCPLPKIEYRYIPRNFYEEQTTETNLKNLYSSMFTKSDIWSQYPTNDVEESPTNYNNFISNIETN